MCSLVSHRIYPAHRWEAVNYSTFRFFSDPGQQPSTVESSGFSANVTVAFAPFSLLYQSLPNFVITNDEIGLETVELYPLQLVSSNPSDFVILASDSTIEIIDDDSKKVFLSQLLFYHFMVIFFLIHSTSDRIFWEFQFHRGRHANTA